MQDDINRVTGDILGYLEFLKEGGVRSLPCTVEAGRNAPASCLSGTALSSIPPVASATGQSPTPAPKTSLPARKVAAAPRQMSDALRSVAERVAACEKCVLYKTRTRTVPGQGNAAPDILFIGEGPGEDEDMQGLAFVGEAGKLLTKMIEAMGYRREDVFIANIVKCRPPHNRKPAPEEAAQCLPFLEEQIVALKPKVIVTLGGTALEGLLGITGITRVRGQWRERNGIPVMPTFHPSYLLRVPSAKRDAWNDLQAVLKRLGRTPPNHVKK